MTADREGVRSGGISDDRLPRLITKDGAFMEPRGCNRWQSAANWPRPKLAKQAKTVAVDCNQLPQSFDGNEESTVRVRQRALQKRRMSGFFFRINLKNLHCAVGMEPFMEPSGRTPQGRSCQIGALSSAASPPQQWRPSSYCNSSRTRLTAPAVSVPSSTARARAHSSGTSRSVEC